MGVPQPALVPAYTGVGMLPDVPLLGSVHGDIACVRCQIPAVVFTFQQSFYTWIHDALLFVAVTFSFRQACWPVIPLS